MAMEHHHHHLHTDFNEDGTSLDKWTSKLDDESKTNSSGGFDCNICLDLVQDPVVTFCGHLYCWPCIYKWITFREVSPENTDPLPPQCPVCKAEVSTKTLIPLYGRGQDHPPKDKDPRIDCPIPQRPPSFRTGGNVPTPNITSNGSNPVQQLHRRNYVHPSRPYDRRNYMDFPTLRTCLVDPMIGVFGEMVYARIFGNSQTTLYAYPNSYQYLAGSSSSSSSPRLRRRMMQTDESLSRIYFFLSCFVMFCLLLF